MKKMWIAAAMAAWLGVGASVSDAQAGDLAVSGDIGVYSQYVWRGMQQTPNASVQGDLGVALGDSGLSANVWFASLNNNAAGGGQQTEFDWTVDYSTEVNGISASVGYIYYSYLNNAVANTGEVYAGLGFGPVSATYYYAVHSNRQGWKKSSYLDLGLSGNLGGFNLGADFGFYFGKKDTATSVNEFPTTKKGLGHVDLSISKDVELSGLTVTPSLLVSIPTWKAANGGTRPHNANQVVAGVNIAY